MTYFGQSQAESQQEVFKAGMRLWVTWIWWERDANPARHRHLSPTAGAKRSRSGTLREMRPEFFEREQLSMFGMRIPWHNWRYPQGNRGRQEKCQKWPINTWLAKVLRSVRSMTGRLWMICRMYHKSLASVTTCNLIIFSAPAQAFPFMRTSLR